MRAINNPWLPESPQFPSLSALVTPFPSFSNVKDYSITSLANKEGRSWLIVFLAALLKMGGGHIESCFPSIHSGILLHSPKFQTQVGALKIQLTISSSYSI